MSREIDDRIVQMQFDNRNFEQNVDQSIKTLDRLKDALEFEDTGEGIDRIEKRMNKFSAEPMMTAIDGVKERFSALEYSVKVVMANLISSVTQTAQKIAYDFTIAPKSAGWNEYELKMGSIQTIMASTGESLSVVNKYLEELNKYSDDTIYSFSDMTNSIGKFTNAGVKLEDAVSAIKGVSNVAAVSGANANEASRAMYNFAQALSSGYVKLIDWKSIENANMATVEFKTQLLESAVAAGTLTKTADGMYKTGKHTIDATHEFNDSLSDAWMTTEVLTKTLKKYADAETEIGKKATAAATEVKTFSMMVDSLKEAVQSSWSQTFEIIFGDFEEGKALWTELSGIIGGILDYQNNMRNDLLESVLGKKGTWKDFGNVLEKSGKSMKGLEDTVRNLADASGKDFDELMHKYGDLHGVITSGEIDEDSLLGGIKQYLTLIKDGKSTVEEFNAVVNDVISGKYSNGEDRVKALTEAGYKYEEVQGLVNYIWEREGHTFKDTSLSAEELAKYVSNLNDVEKQNMATTQDSIDLYDQFLEAMYKGKTGRELVLESLRNLYQFFVNISDTVKRTMEDMFGKPDMEEKANGIYDFIKSIAKMTASLKNNMKIFEFVSKAIRSFYGILNSLGQLASQFFAKAWMTVLSVFDNLSVVIDDVVNGFFDWTASIGDWLSETTVFTDVINFMSGLITGVAKAIKEWYEQTKPLQTTFTFLRKVFTDVSNAIQGFVHNFVESNHLLETFQNLIRSALDVISGFAASVTKVAYAFWDWVTSSKELQSVFSRVKSVIVTIWNTTSKWFTDLNKDGRVVKFFTATLESLFTVISSVVEIVAGAFTQVWDAVSSLFGGLGLQANSLGDSFGSILEKVTTWLKTNTVIKDTLSAISTFVSDIVSKFTAWIKESEGLRNMIVTIRDFFSGAWKGLSAWFDGLKDVDDIPKYIVSGLINGLKAGVAKVVSSIIQLGQALIQAFRDLFQIHSPSALFYSFGAFIIAGLIAGLLGGLGPLQESFNTLKDYVVGLFTGSGAKDVTDAAEEFGGGVMGVFKQISKFFVQDAPNAISSAVSSVVEFFRKLSENEAVQSIVAWLKDIFDQVDINKLFSLGIAGLITKAAATLAKPFEGIAELLGGFGDLLEELGDGIKIVSKGLKKSLTGFSKMMNGVGTKMVLSGIKDFGIAILLLTGSIYILSRIDQQDLIKAGIALAAMTAVITVVMLIASKLSSGTHDFKNALSNSANIMAIGILLAEMAVALVVLSAAVKILGKMDQREMLQGCLGVIALMAALGLVAVAMGKFLQTGDNKSIKAFASVMISMGVGLLILTGVMKIVSGMGVKELAKGIVVIGLLMGFIKKIIKAASGNSRKGVASAVGLTGMILAITIAMFAMVGLCKVINKLSTEELLSGIIFMKVFSKFLKGIIKATKVKEGKTQLAKAGGTLLAASLVLVVMAGVVHLMKNVETEQLTKGLVAVYIMGKIIRSMIKTIGNTEKDSGKVFMSLIAASIAIGVIAVIAYLLGQVDNEVLGKGILAVTILGLIVRGLIKELGGVNSDIGSATGALIAVTVLIGVLTAAIVALAFVPGDDLLRGVAAVTVIIAAVGLLMAALGRLRYVKFSNVVGPITLIASVMGIIFGMIAGLSLMGVNSNAALGIGGAIAMIITALSAVITAIAAFVRLAPNADLKNAVTIAEMLGVVVGAMTLIMIALGAIASIPGVEGLLEKSVHVFQLIGRAIGELLGGLILGVGTAVAEMLPVFADALSRFMDSFNEFAAKLNQIGNPGELLTKAGSVFAVLGAFVTADYLATLTTLSEWLVEKFTGKEAGMIGIVKRMIEFMAYFSVFQMMVKMADASAIESAKTIAEIVMIFATSELINGFTNLFNLDNEDFYSKMGKNLVTFAGAVCDFSKALKENGGIDNDSVETAAAAGKMIAELNNSLPGSGGLMQTILGEKDLGKFGDSLATFGEAMCMFSHSLEGDPAKGIKPFNKDAVGEAASAGEMLANLENSLPAQGGKLQEWIGTKDLGAFGRQINMFGLHLVRFSSLVEGKISMSAVEAASNAGTLLADLNNKIPSTGSKLMKFVKGEQNLADFGKQIYDFGTYMVDFSAEVSGNISQTAVEAASTAGSVMVEFAKSLETLETNSWIDIFTGDTVTTLEDFGNSIAAYGTSMSGFSASIANVDLSRVSSVLTQSDNLLSFMIKLSKNVIDSGDVYTAMAVFRENLGNIAQGLAIAFDSEDSDVRSAIDNAISGFMATMYRSIQNNQSEVLAAVKKFGEDVRDKLCETLTSYYTELVLKKNVKMVGTYVIEGLQDSYYGHGNLKNTFYWIGTQATLGFSQGIRDYTLSATRAAIYVASSSINAMRSTLKVASPSKVMTEIGEFTGEGFVSGLTSYADASAEAGDYMALQSMAGIMNILSLINSVMGDDAVFEPVIRPVLDMSNLQNGAGYIDGMFGGMPGLSYGSGLRLDTSMANAVANGPTKSTTNTTNSSYQNNFYISGDDPHAIAEEVSHILQQQVERSRMVWA